MQTISLCLLCVACFVPVTGSANSKSSPAGSSGSPAASPLAACYAADAVYYSRSDGKGSGKSPVFLGLRSLEGPVACPAHVGKTDLPEPPTIDGHLISVTPGETWQSREQDKLRSQEIAYTVYSYRTYKIVFAMKLDAQFAPIPTDAWSTSEVLGTSASADALLVGRAPVIQGFNGWIEKLGDARPVFERFYRSHNLAGRPREDDLNWAEQNIYKCFEDLGKGDACQAEKAGQMHVQSANHNPYPEAAFCAGYGHLHHDKFGMCHTAGNVNSPFAKCVFSCMDQQRKCQDRTGDNIGCVDVSRSCQAKCS
jgi:hypothetical protein